MKKLILLSIFTLPLVLLCQKNDSPNIIVIITDDQGYGDLGFTGNPNVKTPVLDKFAQEGIRFNNFYVSPVCAPTRSSLMTGRYSLRTGIRDTYNGGAIMAGSEITIAELLQKANYKTGIFGKWHLGDNYPSRPIDQGFDESLIHLSGGMGQVGDFTTWFKKDKSYFDPVLWRNGEKVKYEGYCSDIFTDNSIKFIEKNKDNPFFCYLSFNAPHTPLQVPDKYYQMYKDIDPAKGFKDAEVLLPEMNEKDREDARRVYAMVSNIDDNIGKLLNKLEELNLKQNTLIVFMTDNGPQQPRYVAGMKGRKGSVYRGGVRVPFYLSYPEGFSGNRDVAFTAAHIDLLPTLAEICKLQIPQDRKIDGRSLVPLLKGESPGWKNRSLFFYWSRKFPEKYNGMALQRGKDKLVAYTNYDAPLRDFELYDIVVDPNEKRNIILDNQDLGASLKQEMDNWYKELIASENVLAPPRIVVGSSEENPVFLNRNDASGQRGIWDQEMIYGKWKVNILAGIYNIRFKFIQAVRPGGRMLLETGTIVHQAKNHTEYTDVIEMNGVVLNEMQCDLIPFYLVDNQRYLPFWIEMDRIK